MALSVSVGKLAGDLQLAFKSPLWATCGMLMGTAIDTFILSGTVSTNVVGTIIPPSPPPVPAVGKGTGTITAVPGAIGLTMSAKLSLPATLWADVGMTFASAIDMSIKSATVMTSVIGGLTGVGFGNPGCINTAATISGLTAQLTNAFVNIAFSSLFEACATEISSAVQIYLMGAIVTTIDAGAIPPVSWTGTGNGNII